MSKKIGIFLTVLLSTLISQAQICTGSLGDPVINVTFGSGSNPGGPLASVNNNYNYTAAGCPGDGFYTVVNSTANCFNNTWHNLLSDHTPNDVNGYMMLVNASYTPGDFYVDTVKGLCPNTTYEFAAWVLNVLRSSACQGRPIDPNLTFKIQTTAGVVLGTYDTGDITQTSGPDWKQYGLFFTTPSTVSNIILRLTNNAPGGCGNDLILDDITFRACGASVNAVINYAGGTTVVDLCQGDTQQFALSASLSVGYSNPAYQWQVSTDSVLWKDINGAITPSYNRNTTGIGDYRYRLAVAEAGNITNAACRIYSNVVMIRINANPLINALSNKSVCDQGPMNLQASGASTYLWTGPGGFTSTLSNPKSIASFNNSGTYYVKAITARGCIGIDSVLIQVFPKPTVEAGQGQHLCEGSSVTLHASNATSFLWSPSAGLSSTTIKDPIARPVDSTKYILTIKDQNGCSASDSVNINVSKKPVADAGKEIQLFEGQSAMLQGFSGGTNVRFQWSPGSYMNNSNSLTPTITPPDTITYTLIVTSGDGCGSAVDKVFVRVYQKVVVPNAFSPNGDGINDVWNIENLQTYNEAMITVFNRNGQVVFKSRGYSKRWDGRYNNQPLPFGTYYYTLDLRNGTKVTSGWVLIVR
ncbi:MAG: gliding motility-associated C-terminal domain-containing protein [Chitinophagaceae bacterium]